jgi:hypothetical protein
MKKTNWWIVGVLLVGLGAMSNGEWVREAWAQAKTVMYKDSAQTVTVSHTYTMPTAIPPLIVTGPAVGVPATGFAPDMLGLSTVAGLGAPTPLGKARVMSDGGAAGVFVMADGTSWNCDAMRAQRAYMVTCPPFNAKGDGIADDSAAFNATFGSGNRTVYIPAGTFIVNTILYHSNMKIQGQGIGRTILMQPANSYGAVLGNDQTLVTNVEISHLTIDGQGATQQPGNQFAIFGTNGAKNFFFHHLEVKNSSVYCVGMENGVIQGTMSDMIIGPCGWDGIDLKNAQNATRVQISNLTIFSPGTTMGVNVGAAGAVCLDSGGQNTITNVHCRGLTNGGVGFGFRRHQNGNPPLAGNCDVAYCDGGKGSTLSNFSVETVAAPTGATKGVNARDDSI